ncbi:hypothetical protein KR059_007266 [Drosophila kikkawai]|nr:hypothetical protein KR059_007266 [Drosophila kikkawai]
MVNMGLLTPLLLLSTLAVASCTTVPLETPAEGYQTASRLGRLGTEFSDHYQNITLDDLARNRLPSAEDLKCLADLTLLTNDLKSLKLWALKMIDSWGSVPSGIIAGNLIDLGNYDECLRIDHAVTSGHSVKGKYCFARFPILPSVSPLLSLKTAVCFPASCSAEHMDTMLRRLFQSILNMELSTDEALVSEDTCHTAEKKPYDALTIFTIVVLSILVALVLLSTLCDYFLPGDKENQSLNPWIKAFSARANSRVLFRLVEPGTNPNVIDCLNGIRCLSFIWVVYGHVYLVNVFAPNLNYVDWNTWRKSAYSMLLQHAAYSVDTFFFLSGLLLVVIALRTMDKTKGKLNVPLMYLHRYLRLTPILAMAIIVYMTILPRMGDGPLYGSINFDDYAQCKDTWFWSLLYLQNYATHEICLGHSWYLAVDMQLYIIAPLLLIALYKWGRKGAAMIFVLMLLLASCLFTMMILKDLLNPKNDSMKKIYFSTHTRASPYLIGILFGYFLHVNRGRSFKLSRAAVLLGWLVSLALLFTCLFALFPYAKHQETPSTLEEAFYLTLTRIAWPLGLCWLVFACMQGYGGLANSFLSSPLWQPLSRLSYSAYIFHMFIESLNAGLTRTNTYFSDYQVMLRFWGDFAFTVLLAFAAYILIEAPFGNLEGLLLPAKKPAVQAKVKVQPVGGTDAVSTVAAPPIEQKSPLPPANGV